MKDERNLLSKLIDLGIDNPVQLEEYDIFYWWQKKFREIQKDNLKNQNELLININNAKEELENIDKLDLINILKNNPSQTQISKEKEIDISNKIFKNKEELDTNENETFKINQFNLIIGIVPVLFIVIYSFMFHRTVTRFEQDNYPTVRSLRCRGCDAYSYLEKGNKNYDQRNFKIAKRYYQLAIKNKKGGYFLAEMNMAKAQKRLGDYVGALKTYLKLSKEYPYNLIVLNEMQKMQTSLGKYQEAINTNRKIIEVGNIDTSWSFLIGTQTKGKKRSFTNWNSAIGTPLDVFTTIGDLQLKNRNRLIACSIWRRTIRDSRKIKNDPKVKNMRENNIKKINEWCRIRLDGGRIYSFD